MKMIFEKSPELEYAGLPFSLIQAKNLTPVILKLDYEGLFSEANLASWDIEQTFPSKEHPSSSKTHQFPKLCKDKEVKRSGT